MCIIGASDGNDNRMNKMNVIKMRILLLCQECHNSNAKPNIKYNN